MLPENVLSNKKDEQHPSLRRNTDVYKARRWWFVSRVAVPCTLLLVLVPAKWSVMAAFFLLFIGLSFLDEY